jgi:L-serine deaminase
MEAYLKLNMLHLADYLLGKTENAAFFAAYTTIIQKYFGVSRPVARQLAVRSIKIAALSAVQNQQSSNWLEDFTTNAPR